MDDFDRTEVIIGTPGYMSPERIPPTSPLDEQSDIYEFGCVVYEMLAGQPPFTGSTQQAVLVRHVRASPPSLKSIRPKIPRHVRKAVEKALAKEPEKRHQTVEAFLGALGV
jgi:serine/threonine-protein kinase